MLFQRSTEIAIQALVFLAQQSAGKLSPTREVAVEAGVPEAYLAKVLQQLSLAGLVRTFRGSGKGVEMGRAAEEISLSEVIRATQGGLESNRCVLGLPTCSEEAPCSLHSDWLPHKRALEAMLDGTTVADRGRNAGYVGAVAETWIAPAGAD